MQKCDLVMHARKVRAARKLRPRVAAEMRPLFNHLLALSIGAAKAGYCQRAGREVAQAKRMATKYPARSRHRRGRR